LALSRSRAGIVDGLTLLIYCSVINFENVLIMAADLPRKRPVRRRPKTDQPNPIDVHVGGRVRLRRTLLGLSQEKLGEAIGLTFQQIQKYERGANRIGASRLWELSAVLEVPVQFFFGEMAPETLAQMSRIMARELVADDSGSVSIPGPVIKPETLDLVRAYDRIPVPAVRQRLFELTKALALELGVLHPVEDKA
jgi:transcriptional regulator with XRE-family HTH domain